MSKRTWIIVFALSAAGCHTFQPTTVSDLTPGQDVRARVTGAFSDSLSTILGGDARVIEGAFVESRGPSVYIDVPVNAEYVGMSLQTLNQRVEIPNDAFIEVERKELSKGRTALALGAVAAVAGAIIVQQLSGDTGGGVRPGGGGPVDAVVTAPSISLSSALSWVWSR